MIRPRSWRMASGAALLVWLSFALMLVAQPMAAWATTIDINQFSLYLWSPGVDTSINGSSALQQDIILGPNNLSGGPFSDFASQGFNVSVTNNLNASNLGTISVTITNTTGTFNPAVLIALLDADMVSGHGSSDSNGDSSGPGTNHGSATSFTVDNPGDILASILGGTLDNTDHIGAGPGDVAFGLLYALNGGFGMDQEITANFSLSGDDNGGLRQSHENEIQLFFNGDVTVTTIPDNGGGNDPAPTPEPMTLVLLGTGAGMAVLRRLRREQEAAL